ncbi:hypothetical protein MAR_033228 [Mya arenaria]|uniref:Uncharacterized protein n=1 Tax=Mya arenaria TaxID=6604 RepID=A0ABY7GHQ6_MYAAR|nr:hypothetical protein MAR_033228 [Mya arenaria]
MDKDMFYFEMSWLPKPFIRRGVLCIIYSLFGLIGFLAPVHCFNLTRSAYEGVMRPHHRAKQTECLLGGKIKLVSSLVKPRHNSKLPYHSSTRALWQYRLQAQ